MKCNKYFQKGNNDLMFILTRYPIIPIVCHVSIGIGTMHTEGSIRINIRNRSESQKLFEINLFESSSRKTSNTSVSVLLAVVQVCAWG